MGNKLENYIVLTMGQSPVSSSYNNSGIGVAFLQGNKTFGQLYPKIDTYTDKPTKMAKKGDILMSVRAPVGDINWAPKDLCIGRGLCSIRSKNGNQQYLYYALKFYLNDLLLKQSGTIFGSINKNDINNLVVSFQDYKTQKKLDLF